MGKSLIRRLAQSVIWAIRSYARLLAGIVAAALLLPLAASCTSPTQSYLLNGIGAELPARDVANSTEIQAKYFNYLCKQAGLPYAAGSNGVPQCTLPLYDRGTWTLIVYQGMNDIDRRCDAYLQWLDDKKRSKGPLLSQLGTTKTVTQEIIEITVPNAANAIKAISIVGQAFQLLNDSIENYHSRLLLEVDSSTVNSIVLRGRHNFRKEIMGRQFENRPEAEHVLRSYLRLCLPFAIETNINDYSTLGSLGVSPEGGNTINQAPVAGTPFKPEQKFGEQRPTPPPGPKPEKDFDKVFANPKNYGRPDLILLQNGLCLQGRGVGNVGPNTMAAIKIYEDTIVNSVNFGDIRQPNRNGLIDDFEFNFVTSFNACDAGRFKNMFERVNYEIVPDEKAAAARKGLIRLLNTRFGTQESEDLGLEDVRLRDLIERARTAYGASDYGGFARSQMTQELLNLLVKGPPPNG